MLALQHQQQHQHPGLTTTSASATDMALMDFHLRQRQQQQQQHPQPRVSKMSNGDVQTMSRTHQYRKVMKPLLERKRRARINKCLDELKDLMVSALQTEGESISKLEKADVLELTVRHMQKLKRENALGLTPQATYAGKFKAGYTQCAQQVSTFMSASKEVDIHVSTRLLSHLSSCIQTLESISPSTLNGGSTPPPPLPRPTPIRPTSELVDLDGKYKKELDDDKAWRPWWTKSDP